MKTAIYPGTFDPITYGHLDIARRAAQIFDRVIIVVAENMNKRPVFGAAQRVALIEAAVRDLPGHIEVQTFSGLTVDYARKVEAQFMVRGLRAVTDFEWELQLALINEKLAPDIETVCLMTAQAYLFLSASVVRDVAQHGRFEQLAELVPPHVAAALIEVYGRAAGA
jgi:pantetheine-phosphate adenylyltransferase